jgi:hypothetical protein
MTAAEILKHWQEQLAPYCDAKRGECHIAKDPWHVLELLAATPAGFTVALLWEGDEALGQSRHTGVVRNTLACIVGVARGLSIEEGQELVGPSVDNSDPLYVLVAKIRAKCREIEFPEDGTVNSRLWYRGTAVETTPEGHFANAMRLRFEISGNISEQT